MQYPYIKHGFWLPISRDEVLVLASGKLLQFQISLIFKGISIKIGDSHLRVAAQIQVFHLFRQGQLPMNSTLVCQAFPVMRIFRVAKQSLDMNLFVEVLCLVLLHFVAKMTGLNFNCQHENKSSIRYPSIKSC